MPTTCKCGVTHNGQCIHPAVHVHLWVPEFAGRSKTKVVKYCQSHTKMFHKYGSIKQLEARHEV